MRFVAYSVFLSSAVIGTVALVLGFAIWLEPISNESTGDLARIGWRSNNHWAPVLPPEEFARPLIEIGEYDKYYDVHVLGDSFSTDRAKSWANYIAAAGFSVRVQDLGKDQGIAITDLLENPSFLELPPRLLVYASVERNLPWRLEKADSTCLVNPLPLPMMVLRPGPELDLRQHVGPQPQKATFSDEHITYARDFLIAPIRQTFSRSQKVYELPLTARRFSNVKGEWALLFGEDLDKGRWTMSDMKVAQCALRGFRDRIQANGKTLFVVMIIPDKLSIYHEDLIDRSYPSTVIPRLLDTDLLAPRLDVDLRAAVSRGNLDVYLPNDTHWGTVGTRIAAESLLTLLRTRGYLID